jgi:hypothetical protein
MKNAEGRSNNDSMLVLLSVLAIDRNWGVSQRGCYGFGGGFVTGNVTG